MMDFLRQLFDLQVIPEDAEIIQLVWERPFAPWIWTLFIIGGGLFAIWSYSHLTGNRAGRGMLAATRFAIILLALILLSGPMLQVPRESTEPDWVLILADRSASMQIADVQIGDDPRARQSRDAQLREILAEHGEIWSAMAAQREVVWLGFHHGAFALESVDDEDAAIPVDLGPPDGPRTHINAALDQALQRTAARPISGVVLLSDGRTTDPPQRSVLRRLQADAIPVYTVGLGSPEPLAEVAIRRIDAPRRAYVGDKVPVIVRLDRDGPAAQQRATVRLIDELSGEELAQEELMPGDEVDQITLNASPDLAGETSWRVVVETDEPTLVPENTERAFGIDLIDRPMRVLYVDGYPRWEQRFLKNLLVREESIDSSILLLSADREFAQEGDTPITRLPRSPEEFADFDVIVIGDVPGGYFTPQQLDMIRDHVAERGAGLLWIGGERSTPSTYAGTVLADLLPMRGSLDLSPIARPVNMIATERADRLGVLQLTTPGEVGWPRELSDPEYGWSQLRWAQRIDPAQLKPAAEVLAETASPVSESNLPLVVMMRFGAGASVYVATDEIWRWRFGRGELLPEQFWVQIMRMLGRETLTAAGERAVFDVTPRRAQTGQPIRVDLRLIDAQLADRVDRSVAAELVNDDGDAVAELELIRQDGTEARFSTVHLTDRPGTYTVRLVDPALDELNLEAELEVFAPEDELRHPETDHALLAELSEATGGRLLEPDELSELNELLPNRAVTTMNPLTERIWDTWPFFTLFLLLITAEWIGRKVLRLI
ncbi:MAG: hypothetical protein EA377_05860 [Phycisphaerales bacterium]|nr:MAG: hypothetical protein EA377_05860 [Phycisphaerales bacterium]